MSNKKFFPFPLLLISLAILPLSHSDDGGGTTVGTQNLWCVAKNNAEDSALQTALDWACGPGGADCSPIQQGGPCYDSSDIQRTASYAFNDYYLKNGMSDDACNFDSTAALTSLNPSYGSCKFRSSSSKINGTSLNSTSNIDGLGSQISGVNGSDHRKALTWFWTLVFVHLLFVISRII